MKESKEILQKMKDEFSPIILAQIEGAPAFTNLAKTNTEENQNSTKPELQKDGTEKDESKDDVKNASEKDESKDEVKNNSEKDESKDEVKNASEEDESKDEAKNASEEDESKDEVKNASEEDESKDEVKNASEKEKKEVENSQRESKGKNIENKSELFDFIRNNIKNMKTSSDAQKNAWKN